MWLRSNNKDHEKRTTRLYGAVMVCLEGGEVFGWWNSHLYIASRHDYYVDFPFLFFMVWPVLKHLPYIILSKNFKLNFLNDLGPTLVSTFALIFI